MNELCTRNLLLQIPFACSVPVYYVCSTLFFILLVVPSTNNISFEIDTMSSSFLYIAKEEQKKNPHTQMDGPCTDLCTISSNRIKFSPKCFNCPKCTYMYVWLCIIYTLYPFIYDNENGTQLFACGYFVNISLVTFWWILLAKYQTHKHKHC